MHPRGRARSQILEHIFGGRGRFRDPGENPVDMHRPLKVEQQMVDSKIVSFILI